MCSCHCALQVFLTSKSRSLAASTIGQTMACNAWMRSNFFAYLFDAVQHASQPPVLHPVPAANVNALYHDLAVLAIALS